MEKANLLNRKQTGEIITTVGLIAMAVLSLTQLIPSLGWAAGAVFIGVALFFIVRAIEKTPRAESGLNFKSVISDIKKPGVIIIMLIPMFVTSVLPVLLGDILLKNGYSAHVLARAGGMVSYENLPLLVFEVFILAFGEEIAWRGFFIGKAMKRLPFLVCAVISSALFAIGHIVSGKLSLILFDICFVFIDSMIFSIIYKKSGNCIVSTISHIIGNAVGLIICFLAV